jgi:hypothetical protein
MQIERPGAVQLKWNLEERLPEPGTAAIERRVCLFVRVASGAVTSSSARCVSRPGRDALAVLRNDARVTPHDLGNLSDAAAGRPNEPDGGC